MLYNSQFLIPNSQSSPLYLSAGASGAARAAGLGQVVLVVDVIDMSTTCEAALDEGAAGVYGAAPDDARPPVPVDPEQVGRLAGRHACVRNSGVIVIAEPRVASGQERESRIQKVLLGIKASGAKLEAVLPNLGAETAKLATFRGQVVVAATSSGGVAFDAALAAGAPAVFTGTIARTGKKKGSACALAAARRACAAARQYQRGLAVVAASVNSIEDVLAAEYILEICIKIISSV